MPFWTPVDAGPVAIVRTGVGKANAAGAAAVLGLSKAGPAGVDLVISLGIAGALPGSPAAIGDVVLATSSVFADEGIETPGGYQPLSAMGFGPFPDGGDGIAGDEAALSLIADRLAGEAFGAHRGVVATVSTCAGTDARAAAVAERTGAIAEAMEGAAVGLVAGRWGVRFLEVRAISNTTGDRDRQVWDLDRGLASLMAASRAIAGMTGSGSRTA